MKIPRILTVIFGILTLIILGCSNNQNPIDSSDLSYSNPPNLLSISLPPGAVLDSAILFLYVDDLQSPTEHHVSAHRITAPWNETTVTFNNFGASYDPTVISTFVTSGNGWYQSNITSLVQSWLDGTYPDYGVLIEQPESPYTRYISSEFANPDFRPMLQICYSVGSVSECVTIRRDINGTVSDAVIAANIPNDNAGNETQLYTATRAGYDKQSLFQFNIEVVQEPAAIGDTLWIDENQDGIQDASEPGFPDVTVNLYECLGTVPIATTTTDANGFYKFDNLAPGDYFVEFIEPEGYDITLQDQGIDDAIDSDADPSTGRTICTTLDAGEYDPTWDCGLYLVPQDGCTLTIGFWKTHSGFGPQANVTGQYLPLWLGNSGGAHSILVADSAIAYDILNRNVYGDNNNGITKLYAQLLGAKLNIAAGASNSAVAAIITAADNFLASNFWTAWPGLSNSTKKMVLGWMSALDDYNNGITGPGHCDD